MCDRVCMHGLCFKMAQIIDIFQMIKSLSPFICNDVFHTESELITEK